MMIRDFNFERRRATADNTKMKHQSIDIGKDIDIMTDILN